MKKDRKDIDERLSQIGAHMWAVMGVVYGVFVRIPVLTLPLEPRRSPITLTNFQ